MINFKKYIILSLGFVFLLTAMLWTPDTVIAQSQNDILGIEYGAASGLSNNIDPRFAVARVINVILGLLGTIAVVLVIYSGFTWMTSAGDEGKIDKAKKIITASVIGLAIILSAYIITNFVVANLYNSLGQGNYANFNRP